MVSSCSITDTATTQTLLEVFKTHNYLLDPHGAVAYNALQSYLHINPNHKGLLLETAHPIKFYDVVEPIINQPIAIPPAIKAQLKATKNSIKINAGFQHLKNYLMP